MVKESLEAKVRPLSNTSLDKASLLGAARLYVSKDSLIALTGGLDGNRLCFIERVENEASQDAAGSAPLRRQASLWVLPGQNLSPNVVQMTRAFMEATGLKLGDMVKISVGEAVPDADEVVVEDVTGGEADPETLTPLGWPASIGLTLDRAEQVFPGMSLDGVSINKLRRNFRVLSVNGQIDSVARFRAASTLVKILQPGDSVPGAPDDNSLVGDLVLPHVPGMGAQVTHINNFLDGFNGPFWMKEEFESCGFVIHGGSGTGKTFILEQLAATGWGKVNWIRHFDKLSTIRETFKLARSQKPSMIFIEDLGELMGKDRSNKELLVHTICEELDSFSAEALVNDALPKVVVIATCNDYMTDVPQVLRKASRFHDNVALPIPGQAERLEVLKYLQPPLDPVNKDRILDTLALNTHAYNPRDLRTLLGAARRYHRQRLKAAGERPEINVLEQEDIDHALQVTKPTAMHDINLKPPTIHWQDVGGQESLKKVLSNMIKFARNSNPAIRDIIPNPPKGLLLYGPPGCSKTLSAQAMATESSFNFFAVKGAELLNMYVGESERAVRNLFERARAASPSIIFFDEIDSIAGQRSGPGSSSRSSGSVNTVTTLLTEMDGFESLTGVLVLAATNRPEAMDPALLRPGRFDNKLYVGPPDQTAREAVFRVHLRKLKLSSDVDISELARLAEGYSGAEIKAICNAAGLVAYERYETEGTESSTTMEITMSDLRTSMGMTQRNITKAMIEGYEKWESKFKAV